MTRPSIPSDIKLVVRQEANFGCVVCGCPIIDYHHIVPWHQCKQHEAANLVVLCPTHHRLYGKANTSDVLELKKKPFNKTEHYLSGKFFHTANSKMVRLGPLEIVNPGTILQCFDREIFSFKTDGEELKINAFIPDGNFCPEFEIVENEFSTSLSGMYDISFSGDKLSIRKEKGKNFISLDFTRTVPEITFDLEILGKRFFHTKKKSSIADRIKINPGGKIVIKSSSGISNAILLGDQNHKINNTNHALGEPLPYLTRIPFQNSFKNFAVQIAI